MNKYLLILILLTGVFSCRKDQDIVTTTESEYPVEQYVVTTLKGRVVTDRDIPVKDANVAIDGYKRKTDFNGIFYFKNIKANKAGSTISVTKDGFAEAKSIFYPKLNSTSYVKIELKQARKTSIINTSDKDKIVGDELNEIQITGNSFVKSGSPFTGSIKIFWDYVAGNDKNQIGDPVGFDKHFKLTGLNSVGTLGFKVLDDNGNEVEISGENTYELKLGISNIISKTDVDIPLWRFDTEKGKWLEAGKAIFMEEGNKAYYFAEVKKSGYYNFAKSFQIEKTEIKLEAKSTALPYVKADIEAGGSNNYKLRLTSNDKGVIPCFIPKDKDSKITIWLEKSKITKDIQGETNTLKLDRDFKSYSVTGEFYSCDGEKLTNGYITIYSGNNSMFYFIDDAGFQSKTLAEEKGSENILWVATDLNSEINTGLHTTGLDEKGEFAIGEIYLCQEPFALMQYGSENYLMDLTRFDKDIFSLTFEKGKAFYEINSYPFKGVGEYDLNSCNCTPTIKNSDGERLYIYQNLEHKISIKEYNKPGMIRGGLEAKVRTGFSGTDTTDLKIYYSVFNE